MDKSLTTSIRTAEWNADRSVLRVDTAFADGAEVSMRLSTQAAYDLRNTLEDACGRESEDVIYLVVGPYKWGRGFSVDQATEACFGRATAPRGEGWVLYRSRDPWAFIDGMGSICYTAGRKPEVVGQGKGGRPVLNNKVQL